MKYHSANECLRAATAIKQQVDYLYLQPFENGEDKDCAHHLDQIKQLVDQLKSEVND